MFQIRSIVNTLVVFVLLQTCVWSQTVTSTVPSNDDSKATPTATPTTPSTPVTPAVQPTAVTTNPATSSTPVTPTVGTVPSSGTTPIIVYAPAPPTTNTAISPTAPVTVPPQKGYDYQTITLYTILAFIIVSIIASLFNKSKSVTFRENLAKPQDDDKNAIDIPFGGYVDILSSQRFDSNSELFQKAQDEAEHQTQDFFNKLDSELVHATNTSAHNVIPQEQLQRIADSVYDNMINRICDPDSYWMQLVFNDKAPVKQEQLRIYIDGLLKPVQVPDGTEIQMTPSPLRIGVLAALGAFLGILALSKIFAWCGLLDSNLFAAILGAGLVTGLAFWIASDKARREKAILGIGLGLAIGWFFYGLLELPKYILKKGWGGGWFVTLTKWMNLNPDKDNSPVLDKLKTTTFWGFVVILVLEYLKFPIEFDRIEYENKLKLLYAERVQAIVMLLASVKYVYYSEEQKLKDKTKELNEKIDKLKAEKVVSDDDKDIDNRMLELFQTFWETDIKNLDIKLDELRQYFVIHNYKGLPPDCNSMLFMRQLGELLNGKLPGPEEPTAEEHQFFEWTDDKREQYRVQGTVYSGDIVEELERPIIKNGHVAQKGSVRRKR